MKYFFYILTIVILNATALFSQTVSISGYVSDYNSRETLIGATILLEGSEHVTISDKNGFYSITGVVPGKYNLKVSHIGYHDVLRDIEIAKHLVLDEIKLKQAPLAIGEVSIVGLQPDRVADKEIEIGQKTLTPQIIQSIPTARNDIFSAIKYLPGVDRTEPFSPLYSTRGGDPGENAVLLDGVMIYNPYHSSTTSGIFNTQSIKNVDLLVGGFGAEFGGRNSSVMYITTKDGNPNELHGEIEPSTFHSKVFLEFPAGKDASMVVAGRYLFDVPYNFIFHSSNYFYDYNVSYTKRINNRNRLTIKYFESKDYTGYNFNTFYRYFGNSFDTDIYDDFNVKQRNDWQNRAFTVIHKAIISPRLYLRTQLYYSSHQSNNYSELDLEFEFAEEGADTTSLKWTTSTGLVSEIRDLSAKTALSIKTTSFNDINIGAEYNSYFFQNGIEVNGIDNGAFSRSPTLLSAFVEDKFTTRAFVLRPGMRFTLYRNNQWLYEPRINLLVNLPYAIKFKAAYGQYLQYIISMNTNELEMSQIVDYYYPIWDKSPSKSTHYVMGLEKRISKGLNLTIDAYYKDINNTYTFDINQSGLETFGFSNKLEFGSGKAYGLEFFLQGKFDKFSGWVSYSLAKATRKYPESSINDGEEYPFDYNRRHTFKMVLNNQITPNFALNTSFLLQSGIPRSIETITQSFYQYNPVTNTVDYFPLYASSEKNAATMPPLVNLDFSIRRRLISGFGKEIADFLNAEESYVTVTIRNVLFVYRNVEYYYPGTFFGPYHDKHIPFGSNYLPSAGISYTLKF